MSLSGRGVGDDRVVGRGGGGFQRRGDAPRPGWPACRCPAGRLSDQHVAGGAGRGQAGDVGVRRRWRPRRRPPARPATPASGSAARAVASSLRWCRMPLSQQAATQRRRLLGVVVAFAERLGAAGLAVAVGPDRAATVGAGPGDRRRCPVDLARSVSQRLQLDRPGRARSAPRAAVADAGSESVAGAAVGVSGGAAAPRRSVGARAVTSDRRSSGSVGVAASRAGRVEQAARSSQGPPSHGVGLVDQRVAPCRSSLSVPASRR